MKFGLSWAVFCLPHEIQRYILLFLASCFLPSPRNPMYYLAVSGLLQQLPHKSGMGGPVFCLREIQRYIWLFLAFLDNRNRIQLGMS